MVLNLNHVTHSEALELHREKESAESEDTEDQHWRHQVDGKAVEGRLC